VLGLICLGLMAVAVRAEGPMFSESIRTFGHLRWRPLVLAVLVWSGRRCLVPGH
jgi:hypothetical protein